MRQARANLKKKFGKTTKVGGRRVGGHKKSKKKSTDDKKIKQVVSKFNAQKLPEISNVNLFTDDNKVIQFK
ncbi:MAG: hypothetical protein GY772_04680 [bacterium]|nr:hypothetical protein [bacterium]